MKIKEWIDRYRVKLRKMMMKCFYSGEQLERKEMNASSESLATRDFSASGYSSRPGEADPKVDNSNIEEAESSLRESGFLNYEEARALLGRLEYQKGNIEAALHVFEGIDIPAIIPKIKNSLSRRSEPPRRHSQSDTSPQMSVHAISLLFEAIFLKSKSLQALGRFKEAAESCRIILETIESALPDGFLDFSSYFKLQEIVNKSVELLPELWKLASDPQASILSYRRALLYHWNLDHNTRMNIEKEFAIFLLYSGCDASPPNLKSQMESSYAPKNNLEEAILLLLILLRKTVLGIIEWDPSIYYHLSFALSFSCDLTSLAHQIEEFPPAILERKERYNTLALCYYGEGEEIVSLNLLRSLFNNNKEKENHHSYAFEILLASKICGARSDLIEEGITYLRKLLTTFEGNCDEMISDAKFLLGVSLSAKSRTSSLDSERISTQMEALTALESAHKTMKHEDANVLYNLSLEYAENRKLDIALYHAKQLVKIEAGASVKGWILLARILSAQKQYSDAENIIDAALDETGKWDHGELLRTKAKLQIAQGDLKSAIETYTRLLAVLQVQNKSFGLHKKLSKKASDKERGLEMETWHDLANVYTSLSQWRDAEVCLLKSKAIDPHSASRWHATGLLHQAKGQREEALTLFEKALDVDPNHVPSLISTAIVLRELNDRSLPVAKSFITDALRLDRTNPRAWFNLGLVHKAGHGSSALEAAECFEAAIMLEESEPVEPFR
ncbi:putative 43kDa postsynaptic protein [Helianthus annuus]|uniref:43kDa postsynaptic protein n=1 Tax=Helianthus annuus TaxID=4232 RepID=A0A251SFQ0_HELAN|nr:protein NPGR2 [Helianthus annuus]KAF5768170.1 putative 43kDa postsynaptic protein [Helianthus annuus]KAJ0484965.1 putative tetratricopeptide-like helical domain superfamily, protein NPG1 [Helianthus annuus]KAJ0655516.1 putative tetratricopeptide-like helical domain superfamily, protein NPG1 [Helianthus annuus]KAJ0659203.1 putative tetratricopeptide-like helical domain superfamily, protein NPG1 [Helianthus annuus]